VLNKDTTGIETKVGVVNFPLARIENQDEYEVLLEIHDEQDDNHVKAKINAKIKFVWSMYKMYQDMFNTSEKKLKNLQNLLDKSYQLLENLNGILLIT
jgi:flavoprotein